MNRQQIARSFRLIAAGITMTLAMAACSSAGTGSSQTATTVPDPGASDTVRSASSASSLSGWEQVVADAKGQTVNWYVWGGSDSINRFIDDTYGPVLRERYGVTLHRVAVADTVDAVNQVLAEKQAGVAKGAVDLIWINGENFSTLKKAGLLEDGWAKGLPFASLVNWDNPAVNRDFGEPVGEMESPWSSAQFQLVYDTARLDADVLPRSYAALKTWACAHPGRVTYVAPGTGAFIGTRFVKGALYELSGGPDAWKTFDQSTWDRWSPVLWSYLNDLKPCLWRNGTNYPKDEAELHRLFANGEVDFTVTQAAVGAGALIADGLVPKTAKAFVFDNNSIGDFNYVAIPSTASHKAAAQVLANVLLDPVMQARQIVPTSGFGLGYAIDPTLVSDPDQRAALETATHALGGGATDPTELAHALVGDAAAPYQDMIEIGWRHNVLGGL